MNKFEDFNDYNQLLMFDGNNYETYEDALKDGAVSKTGSTLDDLNIHGDTSSIGFDLSETISCFENCLGVDHLQGGILNRKGQFIKIPFVIGESQND